MRLVSLNLWGGKLFEPLMQSIRERKSSTDIFCFQEVFFGDRPGQSVLGARANLSAELAGELEDFTMYKRMAPEGARFSFEVPERGIGLGLAMFVRNGIEISDSGGFSTWPMEADNDPLLKLTGNLMYLSFEKSGAKYSIANIHGIWQPEGKDDTPERLHQSEVIKSFLSNRGGKKIICGDFNLRPYARSISVIGDGMINLISEYGIALTRSRYYADMERFNDPIADYMFVSPDVNVSRFKVSSEEVSDHLPLTLDFD